MTRDRSRTFVLCGPSPYEIGGAAKRSRLLMTELQARGWTVTVIARVGDAWCPRLRHFGQCRVVELPGFGHRVIGAVFYLLIGLPMALAAGWRSSVVVAIHLTSPLTLAMIAARLVGKPVVAVATTSGDLGEAAYLLGRSALRLRLLRRVTLVVAQTEEQARELVQVFLPAKVRIVPNPVEKVDPPPPLMGTRKALFLGRFSSEKGLECLLDAWELINAVEFAELRLVGEGGRHRSIEGTLRNRVYSTPALRRSVRFEPWISDVSSALREADVFVIASESEGTSNALLEACAAGRIVVASNIPSNVAIVGADYPLMFPVGDAAQLADRLDEALSDEATRTLARRHVLMRIPRFYTSAATTQFEDVLWDATNTSRS